MNYKDTFFAKIPMVQYGGYGDQRISWLHHYVEIVGGITPMNKVNADGSIDVLGIGITRMSNGFSIGSYKKASLQKSILLHAEKLKEAGATIIKLTKNQLVARYKNETAYYVISPLTSETFYKKTWGEK